MASYPGTPSKYPATPGKYPATPAAYPASTAARYPAGTSVSPPTTTIGTIAAANGATVSWGYRLDYGYALGAGGGVSDLLDLTGNGWAASQPVEGSQPLWLPTDANGFPAMQGDGVDDFISNSFSRAAIVAGTVATHVWICMVAAQNTWTINDTLWSDGGATLYQNTTSSGMRIFGGTGNGPQNNNLTGYKRIVAQFTNSASAYLWIGSSLVNGTSVGGVASGTTNVLLAAPGGVRFFDGKIAEVYAGMGDISGPAITAIDTYCVSRYGAGSTA